MMLVTLQCIIHPVGHPKVGLSTRLLIIRLRFGSFGDTTTPQARVRIVEASGKSGVKWGVELVKLVCYSQSRYNDDNRRLKLL